MKIILWKPFILHSLILSSSSLQKEILILTNPTRSNILDESYKVISLTIDTSSPIFSSFSRRTICLLFYHLSNGNRFDIDTLSRFHEKKLDTKTLTFLTTTCRLVQMPLCAAFGGVDVALNARRAHIAEPLDHHEGLVVEEERICELLKGGATRE